MNNGRTCRVQVHGPALRCVRRARGRTLAELADRAAVSVSFLAMVERGVRGGVSLAVFEVLVSELNVRDPRALLLRPYDTNGGSGAPSMVLGIPVGTLASSNTSAA